MGCTLLRVRPMCRSVRPVCHRCDAGDVDTEHVYPYQQRPRPPRIVVFDKRPGGIGAAERLFE
eukprot:20671-Eustigmatos_ZCMA.PRE.1